jgi:hypothetical protein
LDARQKPLWYQAPSAGGREHAQSSAQPDVIAWAESKEGLALRFEDLAQDTHPDRHLIVGFLKEAVGLLFQEREPTLSEREHLVFATRGLDSSLPTFWRYSAREAACALRDPTHSVQSDPTTTAFTRQEFENYLAFLTPRR